MATRASSKKEPSQKAKPKADLPAEKVATPPPQPQQATDLITPSRKKPPSESRTTSEVGCSADQQSETTGRCPGPGAGQSNQSRKHRLPKPESVSLIGETRPKRSESPGTEPKIKSVLPPISKIRPPILTKAPEPVVQPVQPVVPELVPAPVRRTVRAGERRENRPHQTSDHRS